MSDKIKKIIELIEKSEEDSEYSGSSYGLRVQEYYSAEGEQLDKSRVWVDGEITDETLPGTSTIGIWYNEEKYIVDAINKLGCYAQKHFGLPVTSHGGYYGDNFILVRGSGSTGGEDIGEFVIFDAEVLAVL